MTTTNNTNETTPNTTDSEVSQTQKITDQVKNQPKKLK